MQLLTEYKVGKLRICHSVAIHVTAGIGAAGNIKVGILFPEPYCLAPE
jgi:hypothetical protein